VAAADYQLSSGDSIVLTVFGQPQLSAKLTVDASGNVMVPFVGPVRVADLSLMQCQTLIQNRLADGILKSPLVSVGIDQLRPIYILGDVRKPGVYSFRYGSTVESAVAVAGGYGAPGLREGTAVTGYLAAEERLRQLASEQLMLRVREARLEAERDGRTSFAMPVSPSSEGQGKLAKLLADEQAMLSSETGTLVAEIRLLNAQKPRLQQRIVAVGQQILTDQKQLQFVKDEEERSARLLKQGLGVRGPEVQLKLDEANVESNMWNLNAELSRSQMDLGNLDLEIQKAQAAFKKQTLDELQKVREQLSDIGVELPSAWAIRNVKMQEVEGAAAAMGVKHIIEITRSRGSHVVVIKASTATPLQPGDTIDIKPAFPGRLLALQSPTG
jgi:polysaccharide biosynthesis/export protein